MALTCTRALTATTDHLSVGWWGFVRYRQGKSRRHFLPNSHGDANKFVVSIGFSTHPSRSEVLLLVSVEETVPPQKQGQQEVGPGKRPAAAPGEKAKPRGFRPDIQGMRALAVSMVVVYHLYPSLLPGGFAGVDVFFVISGFLITGHLLREYRKTGRIGLLDFWGRRAKRLVPAAALVLTVTWVASRFVLPATQLAGTAVQIRASALYFQNWQLAANAVNYLKSDSAASPVQHFWSLSLEEQFYLLWPCILLLAGAKRCRWIAAIGAIACARGWLRSASAPSVSSWFSPLSREDRKASLTSPRR